jgi:hypothetical protein
MGLKGYGLWVMGQLDSMCRAPPRPSGSPQADPPSPSPRRSGAVRVAFFFVKADFEKPGFHFMGLKGWVTRRAFKRCGSTAFDLCSPTSFRCSSVRSRWFLSNS